MWDAPMSVASNFDSNEGTPPTPKTPCHSDPRARETGGTCFSSKPSADEHLLKGDGAQPAPRLSAL